MKRDDAILGSVFALIGLFFFVMSLPFGVMGKAGVPGAGFFPLITSGGLILFSAALAIQGIKSKDTDGYWKLQEHQQENRGIFLLTVLGVIGALAVWKFVNFALAAYLLSIYLNRVYKQSWKFSIIFTIIFVSVLIICFEKIMMVQFAI